MDWLNYHHLLYFWAVARQGSIVAAAEELKVSQPTISSQIRDLEESLGEPLFERTGRRLVLTEGGRLAFGYAEQIFSLGREMADTLRRRLSGGPLRLVAGIADALPKSVARLLLEPVMRPPLSARLVCREGKVDALLAELGVFRLDVVLSDRPIGAARFRGYNHLLGECGVSFFGSASLARKHQRGFPESLSGAPFLLPSDANSLRRSLDAWFESVGVRPDIIGEFEDLALMKTFGQSGLAVFPAPSAAESEICRQYNVQVVGRAETVRERYYAISGDRKLKHPAVIALCQTARQELFA